MSEKISKTIKSNVRGVLLSKKGGVPLEKFLIEYKAVINETLDLQKLGFKSPVDFLEAIPDVARIVKSHDGSKRVLGIALNEFNITALKSSYKAPQNGGHSYKKFMRSDLQKTNNQPEISRPTLPTTIDCKGSANSYDFRATFMKETCPALKVIISDFMNNHTDRQKVDENQSMRTQPTQNSKDQPVTNAQVPKQAIKRPSQVQAISQESNGNKDFTTPTSLAKLRAELQKPSSFYGTAPRSMVSSTLQQMFDETCPGKQLPRRSSFPSTVDIMLTHVDPQDTNYFWGIIVSPYDVIIDVVLNLDDFKHEFKKYSGGKRAVVRCQDYYSRAWITSIKDNMASVFMIDFGNTEEVPLSKLELAPTHLWNCPPIAVPFKHDKRKDFDIEKQINERFRCQLKDESDHIFAVESMIKI